MKISKNIFLILCITFLGGLLRFYQLGIIPKGFHRDEAFLGYNAYSIFKTGKDMSGHTFPLHLESFIWSPALYSYASIPFVALFGLSPFSVRFASALFGSLTIPILYHFMISLTKLIHPNVGKEKNNLHMRSDKHLTVEINSELFEKTSLASAFLLSISPWHINLSRLATENIIVVFFILFGMTTLFQWFHNKKPLFLIISNISFILTIYLYQAPRAFLPFIVPILFLLFWKYMNKAMKIQYSVCFFLFICFPLLTIFSSKTLSTRATTVGLFATEETQLIINESLREGGVQKISPFIERVFHNKILGYGNAFFKNYTSHFSYLFLFTDMGFPDRYRIPNIGLVYMFEIPFLMYGLFVIIRMKSIVSILIISMLLITPLGSAYAFDDVPNLQRTLLLTPFLSICSSVGLLSMRLNVNLKKLMTISMGTVIIYSLLFYLHQYYVHMPIHKPWYRHEGYNALVEKVNALSPNYSKVIITNRESAPAIFVLFFSAYNPIQYLSETSHPPHRSFDRLNFGPYEFSTEECPVRIETITNPITGKIENRNIGEKGILYINGGLCEQIPFNARIVETISRSDGTKVFDIIEMQ